MLYEATIALYGYSSGGWFTKGTKRIKSEEKNSQCFYYFTYENIG